MAERLQKALAATGLAGTSLSLKQEYNEAAGAYREVYARIMEEKTGSATTAWWMRGTEENADEIDPYELPVFEFTETATSERVTPSLPALAILFLFNIVFFAGAFVAFLKYDVR